MKRCKKLISPNKHVEYVFAGITVIIRFSEISQTYFGAEFRFWDDGTGFVKNNLWVLDILPYNAEELITKNGFEIV
jgi:hypothetical protein